MFKNFLILLCSLLILLSCDHSTSPESKVSGITYTDDDGHIIGAEDINDWQSICYPDIVVYPFNNTIMIDESFHKQVTLETDTLNKLIEIFVSFKNISSTSKTLTLSEPKSPFTINKTKLILAENQSDSVLITFIVTDTTVNVYGYKQYTELLSISDENMQTETIYIMGYYFKNEPPFEDTFKSLSVCVDFYPAYPNPAIKNDDYSVILKYSLPKEYQINLAIYNSKNKLVATLVDATHMPGIHNISWGITDIIPGLYRAVLNIEGAETYGDILIE